MSFLFLMRSGNRCPAQGKPADVLDFNAGGVWSDFYFMILRPQQKRTKEHTKADGPTQESVIKPTVPRLVGRVTKVAESVTFVIALTTPRKCYQT